MIEVVAEQAQRDDRVDGGRLDSAEAAVRLLPGDDPAFRGAQGVAAQWPDRVAVVAVQRRVQPEEEGLRRARPAASQEPQRGAQAPRVAGGGDGDHGGAQLVQVERRRQLGALRRDDRQRDDGLAGTGGERVDVQRCLGRQEHDLGRQDRQLLPAPPAEQRQPDPGEHPRRRDAAALADPRGAAPHRLVVGGVTGEPQGDVGLDRGGQLPGAAEERRPGAVVETPGANVLRGGLGLLGGADTEELPQQEVLGVHRRVGLQVELPPSVGVLKGEQMFGGPPDRLP